MSILDVARGAYVRSPAVVRRSLQPLLALVPTDLKYGRTYRQTRAQIAAAEADPQLANRLHLERLRALLIKARAGSPFYRALIDEAFGEGADLTTIVPADLRRLPIQTRCTLTKAGEAALAEPRARLDESHTSGSNAEAPFTFFLDKDRSAREIAFVHDIWSRSGFEPGTAKAVLRGFRLPDLQGEVHEWVSVLQELRLSVFPMSPKDAALYLDLIDERQIRYIYGYTSGIELFCRHLMRLGRRPRLPILGILPISEPLYPHQRRLFTSMLGAEVKIVPFYGLSEKALFAAEAAGRPDIYDFQPLYGVAELVDDGGQPVTRPGREGRLIGTGFLSTGMPFIRYDTQDRARLVELPTPENGQRLRVEGIMPRRKPDFLIGRSGERIVTTDLTPADPAFFHGIEELQFYQDAPGRSTIRYILSSDGAVADIERMRDDLNQKAEGKLAFDIEAVTRLATPTGKRAFIDQRLDVADY